jgi:hypothetical protein
MPLDIKIIYFTKKRRRILELGINSLCCCGYEFSTDFKYENLQEGTLECRERVYNVEIRLKKTELTSKTANIIPTYMYVYVLYMCVYNDPRVCLYIITLQLDRRFNISTTTTALHRLFYFIKSVHVCRTSTTKYWCVWRICSICIDVYLGMFFFCFVNMCFASVCLAMRTLMIWCSAKERTWGKLLLLIIYVLYDDDADDDDV